MLATFKLLAELEQEKKGQKWGAIAFFLKFSQKKNLRNCVSEISLFRRIFLVIS
jgi:hypothetical protein